MRTTSTSPRRSALPTVPVPSTIPVNMPQLTERYQSSKRRGSGQGNRATLPRRTRGLAGPRRSARRDAWADRGRRRRAGCRGRRAAAARGRAPPGRRGARPGRSRAPPSRPRPSRSGGPRAARRSRAQPRETRPVSARTRQHLARRAPRGARRGRAIARRGDHEHGRPRAAGPREPARRRQAQARVEDDAVNGRRVRGRGRSSGSSARTVPMPTSDARRAGGAAARACAPLRGARDPPRVAARGGDAAVEGQGGLQQHEGPAFARPRPGSARSGAGPRRRARRSRPRRRPGAAGRGRGRSPAGSGRASPPPRAATPASRTARRAGRRAAVVGAGLEVHVERSRRAPRAPARAQGHDLGVRTARRARCQPSPTTRPSFTITQPDHRVRVRLARARARRAPGRARMKRSSCARAARRLMRRTPIRPSAKAAASKGSRSSAVSPTPDVADGHAELANHRDRHARPWPCRRAW